MKLKKYYAFGEDKPPIYFREGTSDAAIIQANIIDRNEYLFPRMKPEIVFDIGGNIGVIACILANIYPEATIHTFEPVDSNYEILLKNVEPYKNVVPHPVALGSQNGNRPIWPSEDKTNHGGFSMEIMPKGDGPVGMYSTKNIADVIDLTGFPDLIKIDVEGAEYEILSAMRGTQLAQVKWIAGELHGIKDFLLLEDLKRFFKIKVQRNFEDVVYHFHAVNRHWTPASDQDIQPTVP